MVGIGGGVPSQADLRLGDIVVGRRVMQYDQGKVVNGGEFERTTLVSRTQPKLSNAISKLRAIHESTPSSVPSIIRKMVEKNQGMGKYAYPEGCPDMLFQASYDHQPGALSCECCDSSMLAHRSQRTDCAPKIHYGSIASGNQVMKHGITRDRIGAELQVLCFEMEAAGLMEHFPCLVIRGICDYSDSHKNKEWQEYAAAAAAAYAKELLEVVPALRARENMSAPEAIVDSKLSFSFTVCHFLDHVSDAGLQKRI